MALLGRWRSPDGVWAVEVWQSRRESWYRVIYSGSLYADKVSIATARRILWEQGDVDWADLVED